MSKSSGIMKIDSPGKLGPGLNIDQDVIRKQILAAKQVMFCFNSLFNVIHQVMSFLDDVIYISEKIRRN